MTLKFKIPKGAKWASCDKWDCVIFWAYKPKKKETGGYFIPRHIGESSLGGGSLLLFTGIRRGQCIELKPEKKGRKK